MAGIGHRQPEDGFVVERERSRSHQRPRTRLRRRIGLGTLVAGPLLAACGTSSVSTHTIFCHAGVRAVAVAGKTECVLMDVAGRTGQTSVVRAHGYAKVEAVLTFSCPSTDPYSEGTFSVSPADATVDARHTFPNRQIIWRSRHHSGKGSVVWGIDSAPEVGVVTTADPGAISRAASGACRFHARLIGVQ
jgi:hypothetical protein